MATICRICLLRLSQRSSYAYGTGNLQQLWRNGIINYQSRGLKTDKKKADEKTSEKSSTASSSGPPQANMKVCEGANIYKTGSDPELKEDSAYPDWLWAIGEPPPPHTELSPDTKQYWRRLNKTKAHERNILKKQSAGR